MSNRCVRLTHSDDSNGAVTVASSNGGIVGFCLYVANYNIMIIHIFDSQIHAHQVDFWERVDQLKTGHHSKQYPPSIEMTVLHAQPQAVTLSVNFEGCTAEYVPKFQIILPAGMIVMVL